MAYGITYTNTACNDLPSMVAETCEAASGYCDSVSSTVTMATIAIALPIISLAGEILAEGIIDTTLMVRDLGKWCCRKKEEYHRIDEELPQVNSTFDDAVSPPAKTNKEKAPPVWKRVFGTTKTLTTAVALGAIAIVIYDLGMLFSSDNCQSMRDRCTGLSTQAVDTCNWVDTFLVNVINQVVQEYLHH